MQSFSSIGNLLILKMKISLDLAVWLMIINKQVDIKNMLLPKLLYLRKHLT